MKSLLQLIVLVLMSPIILIGLALVLLGFLVCGLKVTRKNKQ